MTSPSLPISAARCVVFPPGAAHRSSTRSPGLRVDGARDQHRGARLRHQRARARTAASRAGRTAARARAPRARRASAVAATPARASSASTSSTPARSVLTRAALSAASLSALIRARAASGPSCSHHISRDPVRVRVQQRGFLRGRVAEPAEHCAALARGAAQHGVHEAVAAAARRLGEVDRLRHRRVVGDAVHVEELVRAQPQRGDQLGVEVRDGTVRHGLEHMVERAPALHDAVGEPHRERAVAAVERRAAVPRRGTHGRCTRRPRRRGGSPCRRSGGPGWPSGPSAATRAGGVCPRR